MGTVTSTIAPGLPGLNDSDVAWGDFVYDGRLNLRITGLTSFSGGAVSHATSTRAPTISS